MKIVKYDSEIKPSALQNCMHYRGMTQVQLSSKIKGVSQATLSRFLNGHSKCISKDKLEEIMKVLNFPYSILYTDFKPIKTSLNLNKTKR